jgi:hypothetical protein
MSLTRFARVLILTFTCLTVLALLPTTPAFAAPPLIIHVNDVFEDPFLSDQCGFPVEVSTTGQLIIRSRDSMEDTTGANYKVTLTNLESGKSITIRTSGLQRISFTDTSITFSFSGGDKLVVPGQGAVFINVGRFVQTITFDPETGEVTVDTVNVGHPDELSIEQICALLAP